MGVASVEEIVARCVEGDYLRAALMAAGRAFAGVAEVDPRFDALIVAHHVLGESRLPPWPEWCYDPSAAAGVCRSTPESARLVLLAAQHHLSHTEGLPPMPDGVTDELLEVFNDLPKVRNWLTAFQDVLAVPGLWEQICRPAPADPKAEYRDRRKAFEERYALGLLHRSDKAAYIHRMDNYLSRQPPVKKLREHLEPASPGRLTTEVRQQIATFLQERPSVLVDNWLEATAGATGGKVKFRGNQRNEMEWRAEEYLDLASRAWRAGEALDRAPAHGDVERRRKHLYELLPAALRRAQGKIWRPLLGRLSGGTHA